MNEYDLESISIGDINVGGSQDSPRDRVPPSDVQGDGGPDDESHGPLGDPPR